MTSTSSISSTGSLHWSALQNGCGRRLYGRKREEQELLEAYQAVQRDGRSQLVLISGLPGTGKTALANALRHVIQKDKGFFISGKFEQMISLEPYEAFVSALTEYTEQLFDGGNPTRTDAVKSHVAEAIGPESAILTDVIPALERLLGTSRTATTVYGSAAVYRFRYVFCCLVRALTQCSPLVLFLDDVQWADIASTELVRSLLHTSDMSLLLICAQRHGASRTSDNSVPSVPSAVSFDEEKTESGNTMGAFSDMIRDLEREKTDVRMTHIRLDVLNREHVGGMLSDLLHKPPHETEELAAVVCQQSHGNAFHVLHFLRLLLDEGLLCRDEQGTWKWNSDQIKRQLTSVETILGLVRRKIESLPRLLQECLKVASCMGDAIDDSALDLVLNTHSGPFLEQAVNEGLLVFQPHLGGYWFAHDLIRQTAFEMIPEDDRAEFYLKIGRRLWQSSSAVARDKNIFVIVTLLNRGVELMTEERERTKAAELNLKAGEQAMKASAFSIASMYLQNGIKLLGSNRWNDEYELTLALYCKAAEVEVINGRFEDVVALCDEVLKHGRCLTDKLPVYVAWLSAMSQQDSLKDVTAIGLGVLRQLGEPLPEKASKFALRFEFLRVRMALQGMSNDDLLNLRPMKDKDKTAAMQFLSILFICCYQMRSPYTALIAFRSMRLTMKYGVHPGSPVAFAFYGTMLCGLGLDVQAGRRFGELAVSMAEGMGSRQVLCKAYLFYAGGIRHWSEPVKDTLEDILYAAKLGNEAGDVSMALIAENVHWSICCILGTPSLAVVGQQCLETRRRAQLFQCTTTEIWCKIILQYVRCLTGQSRNPARLSGVAMDFDETLRLCEATKNDTWKFTLNFSATDIAYMFCDYTFAGEMAEKLREFQKFPSAFYLKTESPLLYGLVAVALARQGTRRSANVKVARSALKLITKWSKLSPRTQLAKEKLLEAELSSLQKNKDASGLYVEAIELATQEDYRRYAALACERFGDYLFSRGDVRLAAIYWNRARSLYEDWGATAKVQQLQQRMKAGDGTTKLSESAVES